MTDSIADTVLDARRMIALMRLIADNADRGAFAELFKALAPRVKGYLARLGCDFATAEEIAQEVMLTVWRRADSFNPAQAGVVTWVFTIARNRRIDRLRHERMPELDPSDPMLVPEPLPRADDGIEIAQMETRLRRAMADLPKEQAELLEMAYYQDKAHSGIAAERRIPIGTVKSRLRLALVRLRKALGEEVPS